MFVANPYNHPASLGTQGGSLGDIDGSIPASPHANMDTAAGVRSAQHAARDIEQTRLVVANEDGGWIVSAACADIPGNLDNAVDYSDVAIERHALAPTLDLLPIAFPGEGCAWNGKRILTQDSDLDQIQKVKILSSEAGMTVEKSLPAVFIVVPGGHRD